MRKTRSKHRRGLLRRARTVALAVTPLLMLASTYALARTEAPGDRRQPEPPPKTWFPRPFEGTYPVTLANAIVSLVPFIVVTTAYTLFSRQVEGDLHVGQRAVAIVAGISTAGYAFGALVGGDLVQRFSQRPLFFACEALFVLGCVASAAGHGIVAFGAGRILAGLATGLLLVIALPPVIQKFPPDKLPTTVVFINLGFFGAVCIGPLIGGWVAAGHHWRWFFGGLGAIAALNLLLALFTLPPTPPTNPGVRFDPWAIIFGFGAVVLPFWAAGELATHGFAAFRFAVPLSLGLASFVLLILVEYHQEEPLSPVKPMWTTASLVGTLMAMIAGGAFVAFLELGERLQMEVAHRPPVETGILFWPLAVAVCVTAVMLGLLLKTRYLPFLVLGGMLCLIGGGALIMTLGPEGQPARTLSAAGLLGLGAGATVSPGLYLAGFPLPSKIIGRVFALVELVRSLADYIIAPVIARIAREGSHKPPLDWPGVREAAGITLWITVGFTVIGVLLWIAGGVGLPVPDIQGWIKGNKPAIRSPVLLARLRGPQPDEGQ
ncbi:MAG TPA: MFS transporter [Acetobacteraceae bacterium]|nr:MFS transporter [Acetobacteraceae bacterium]